jgi:membrane-associated protease RseP (regulator of RpoE activity)
MKARITVLVLAVVAVAAFYIVRRSEAPKETSSEAASHPEEASKAREGRTLIPSKLPGQTEETAKSDAPPPKSKFSLEVAPQPALSGVEMHDATDADREKQGVTKEYGTGVTVTSIHPDSSAAEVSMEIGDVIVRAQKENVNSLEDLKRIVGERDHTVINFMRGGQLMSVVLQKPFVAQPKEPR